MAPDKTDKTDKPVATTATSATWGTPDWRDALAYVEGAGWDLDRWQWEFLRRRDDYHDDFALAAESLETSKTRFEHDVAFFYEMEEFYDPKIGDWGEIGPIWHPLPLQSLAHDGFPLSSGSFVEILFDVSKPLAPQLVEAKKQLELERGLHNLSNMEAAQLAYGVEYTGGEEIPIEEIMAKSERKLRAPKHHRNKWPTYLRVIDARDANISWSEITEFLFKEGMLDRRKAPEGGYTAPPPQAARDLWLQAQALRF